MLFLSWLALAICAAAQGTAALGRARGKGTVELGYSAFRPDRRDVVAVEGPSLPGGALGGPQAALIDCYGGGLPDVLELNGHARTWRNLGGGAFEWLREMPEAPAGLRLSDRGVQLLDADGDGRMDLMVVDGA